MTLVVKRTFWDIEVDAPSEEEEEEGPYTLRRAWSCPQLTDIGELDMPWVTAKLQFSDAASDDEGTVTTEVPNSSWTELSDVEIESATISSPRSRGISQSWADITAEDNDCANDLHLETKPPGIFQGVSSLDKVPPGVFNNAATARKPPGVFDATDDARTAPTNPPGVFVGEVVGSCACPPGVFTMPQSDAIVTPGPPGNFKKSQTCEASSERSTPPGVFA